MLLADLVSENAGNVEGRVGSVVKSLLSVVAGCGTAPAPTNPEIVGQTERPAI